LTLIPSIVKAAAVSFSKIIKFEEQRSLHWILKNKIILIGLEYEEFLVLRKEVEILTL
jgi:hypothetical protein